MESERNFVPKPEKPNFVYHGSQSLFEQAKPQEGFRWESREGIKCDIVNGQVVLQVPERHAHRLDHPFYLYKMSGNSFSHTTSEGSGQTWDSEELVTPEEEPQTFSSVTEAVEHFGGVVEIIKD